VRVADSIDYAIGSKVQTSDGVCGELARIVVDPVARSLTHLVVQPHSWSGSGRLVPIGLVATGGAAICLDCSQQDFDALEEAEESHFITEAERPAGYADSGSLAWPYYPLGGVDPVAGAAIMGGAPNAIMVDRIPLGEVEIRRGEPVAATDGEIGRVRGLTIDPRDHHVTHVLLEDGHLWGKRQLAIPIGAVRDVSADGVSLTLTRAQVKQLPPVALAG